MKYGMTLLLVAVMSMPYAALAEGGKPPMTDKQLNKMQVRLQLNDDQVVEMRQIRDDGGTRKDMRAVLNDEQKARAKELRKEHKEKGGKKAEKNSGEA